MMHPITIITLCVLLYQPLLLAAPKAELWPVWLTSAEKVTLRPDHAFGNNFYSIASPEVPLGSTSLTMRGPHQKKRD